MIKTTAYNQQRRQFEVTTVREWTTENGHKVTITTIKSIDTNTHGSRFNRVHTTSYICECGKKYSVEGRSADKTQLAKHDSMWRTQEEIDAVVALIMGA